jgi:N-acetyl-anhydromuramyl-L-alanine amidase AmpD
MIHERPAALGNFASGRKKRIDMIVLHVMEGGFGPTGAWFANPDSHASAHFGISVDGSIDRYVREADTAWHAGHPDYNARSIGIELEGHVSDPDAFTPRMLEALTDLCDSLCAQWSIGRDRVHVIGHNEVPDPRHPDQLGGAGHHTDPGPYFPWQAFMDGLAKRIA